MFLVGIFSPLQWFLKRSLSLVGWCATATRAMPCRRKAVGAGVRCRCICLPPRTVGMEHPSSRCSVRSPVLNTE